MRFGAHISTAKPFSDSIVRAKEVGCECMQIFVNPPQRWNPAEISEAEIERFNKLNLDAKINPIIIHSIYLINLASNNPFYYEQSIKSLIDDMQKAAKIGAIGTNVHIGSTKGGDLKDLMKKIDSAIKKILDETPKKTDFVIENSAGAGNVIGDTIEEIAQIVWAVKSPRIKVLIDTAHAFESGYDLKLPDNIEKFLTNFEREIGLDKLVGFHLNDSKTAVSSHHDRHADIGQGEIGLGTFEYLAKNPKLKDKFGILETPQEQMGWKKQIQLLKSFR